MAGLQVTSSVFARSSMGRFRAGCEYGARETVERMIERGAAMSRTFAPRGSKPDPRTATIRGSITTVMYNSREGSWGSSARHAMAQEKGAVAHTITGNPYLKFYWEAEGRDVSMPTVNHPGNAARPYLRPAYGAVMRMAIPIAREAYPG